MEDNLEKVFIDADFTSEEKQILWNILTRIASFVEEFGYEDFVNEVTRDGGQWGSQSGVGSKERINIIPGQKDSGCYRTLLALGRGTVRSSSKSVPRMMRKVRRHLIECFNITNLVIFVTDVWDPKMFKESEEDIKAHMNAGKKFVFILVNGKQITPMNNPYL